MTSCCNLYAHPAVKLLLGESWHPGGLDLTRRTIERSGARGPILDIACGGNRTAAMLREMGIRAVGVDAGAFPADVRGDAHRLPFADGVFETALIECALSTFADQRAALRETRRVAKKLAVSDMILEKPLPESWGEAAASLACLVYARGVEGYRSLLAESGYGSIEYFDEREALIDMLGSIRDRLLLFPIGRAREILAEAQDLVRRGDLGYGVFLAS
jgi:SAM-dependent methyltransferase